MDVVLERASAALMVRSVQGPIFELTERATTAAQPYLDELVGECAPLLHVAVRRCAHASVSAALDAIGVDLRSRPSTPAEGTELASMWAHLRLPLSPLIRGVRLGHAELAQVWLEAISGSDLDARGRHRVVQSSSRLLFDFADGVANDLERTYERERVRVRQGSEARRLAVVREMLAGRHVDEDALGYRCDAEHVGLVGWGERPEHAVRAVAAGLGGTAVVLTVAPGLAWGWAASPQSRCKRVMPGLERLVPAGSAVAVGSPGAGIAGFRQTHEEALATQNVALRRPRPLTTHAHVALEALLLQHEQSARAFVAGELGTLTAHDARTVRLRETLRAYLTECGQNATATAARLGVHNQTVRYHLRIIEERLQTPIPRRSTELATALRLLTLFDEELTTNQHYR